jgi:hypothetical protein
LEGNAAVSWLKARIKVTKCIKVPTSEGTGPPAVRLLESRKSHFRFLNRPNLDGMRPLRALLPSNNSERLVRTVSSEGISPNTKSLLLKLCCAIHCKCVIDLFKIGGIISGLSISIVHK